LAFLKGFALIDKQPAQGWSEVETVSAALTQLPLGLTDHPRRRSGPLLLRDLVGASGGISAQRADAGERFFRRGAHQGGIAERKAMIDPEHDLPIQKQAEVLEISSSSVYYQPRPVSEPDLWLMRRIDELHMNYPFARNRILRDLLWQQGLEVGAGMSGR
jgi:hypothetical protein